MTTREVVVVEVVEEVEVRRVRNFVMAAACDAANSRGEDGCGVGMVTCGSLLEVSMRAP